MTNPKGSSRWHECDAKEDWFERQDCRTSALNDGFHELRGMISKNNFRLQVIGVLVGPIVGAVIKSLMDNVKL